MTDKCDTKCAGLERLEQQVDDIRQQNGQDHKDFRTQIQQMEMENARQKERFDRIMDTLSELKSDNKQVIASISVFSNKADDVDRIEKDVEELKGKSGKTWEDIKSKALGWGVVLVLVIVATAMGLSQYL